MTVKALVSRRWWWVTLIVIVGVIVLVRLGIWQLDRLDQRRTFNSLVYERWVEEPYDITADEASLDPEELEYRRVQVSGEFDYGNQIALKNQLRGGSPGVNLVTPLVLEDGRAVLVARGWIPISQAEPEQWSQFDESSEEPIVGLIQESQLMPNDGAVPVPDQPEQQWFYVNIDAIQPQMPYELLPVFIMQLPDDDRTYDMLPVREEPLTLHEGDHLSYAVQWFSFALMLGIGYIFFVRHMERKETVPSDDAEYLADTDVDGSEQVGMNGPTAAGETIESTTAESAVTKPAVSMDELEEVALEQQKADQAAERLA